MNQNQIHHQQYNLNKPALIDQIRQRYYDINHPNESISNLNLDYKGKIGNFIQYISNLLNNKLQTDILNEIINDTSLFFSVYPKFSLPFLDCFLTTCKLNSNFIIITASIISELTIANQKVSDTIIDSFVDESLKAILLQNNVIDINLFGHAIPQQFKNNLIINLLISSKVTEKYCLLFLYHILPNHLYSDDKKFHFLLQKMIDSSLINALIDDSEAEKELNEMISNKSIKYNANLNEKILSFISCVIFFVINNGKKDIKDLNSNTILPFLAIMTIYLINNKKQLSFKNKNFQMIILNGIEKLEDKSSDLLKTSIAFILFYLDYFKQNQIIANEQYTKKISILADKLFKNQFQYDINLILPTLFNNSLSFYSIFSKYGMDLLDFMIKNCSNIEYFKSKKLNISIIQEEIIIKYINDQFISNDSKTIMQSFHFLHHYCDFTPSRTFFKKISFLIQFFNEKINKKCWDDAILIGSFMKKNSFIINQKQYKNQVLPNHVLNILFGKSIQEMNINELLPCILNETDIKTNDLYFNMLLNAMIDDPYIRCNYLEHLIYTNSGDYIHCSMLLHKLSKKYEKYQEDFVNASQKIFYLHKENNVLYKKKNYKLHCVQFSLIGNKIITEIFDKIKDKPINDQEFICLFKIAKVFPFLFYNDPQQAFKSVLKAFDFISFIYNDLENEHRDIFIKNTISAMSFLFTIMQFPYILDNFLQWFFLNIIAFTNSQIYGFILLLNNFTQEYKSKIILGYVLKYNFLEIIEKILEKEHQDNDFQKQFIFEINSFITKILQIMMNLTKYEIIQIEELMKKDYPISFMNVSSLDCNNLHCLITQFNKYLTNDDQFLKVFENENEFWLSYKDNQNASSFDQIKDFIGEMNQNAIEFKTIKNIPQFNNFYTIKMIRYLVTKPKYIYDWFLYGKNNLKKDEQKVFIEHTYQVLKGMSYNAKEDPSNNENVDCEQLNIIDYFKPQIIILLKLIIFISFHQKNIEMIETLIHKIMANCEFTFCFTDFLFKYFTELSTNYDEINIDSMNNLLDLFKYLLTINEFKNETRDFLKCNLINLALSPKWRNDLSLLTKTLEVMIDYNSEFPFHIVMLIKFLLIENNGQFGSIINIYHKLNQDQKEKLYNTILKWYQKIIFQNDVKAVIDNYEKLPISINDKIELLIRLLNKNARYFRKNLDKKTIKFLFNSFDSLAHYFNVKNNDNIELSHDFYKIYDKYNNLFNRIIKSHPKKMKKYDFLKKYPELISFNVRLNIFNIIVKGIKKDDVIEFDIDRNYILESSYLEIKNKEPSELLKKIKINFINERGLDLGGPLRDWFTNLSLEIFNPNFALFCCYGQEKQYQPNKKSFVNDKHLEFLKFAGKIVARALIEGVCINVNFTAAFWKQILQYEPSLNDLKEVDFELYNSLQSLNNNDVDSLCLSFTYDEDEFGSYLSIPLKEDGSKIDVTNENKDEYIQLLSNYILKGSIQDQVNAFCDGFYSLLSFNEIRIFTSKELNMLIGGSTSIDVNDFKNNTKYQSPYNADTQVVKLFFDVISKWNNEKLSLLLTFITGSSRLPINGFKGFCDMNGSIIIAPGGDKNLLPQAHTCLNRIDLPEYETEDELNDKLTMAIENCNSFEFI